MLTIVLLILSIVMQLVATIIAYSLVKVTKFNASWIILTVVLTLLLVKRIDDLFLAMVDKFEWATTFQIPPEILVWAGILISLCLVVAMLLIRRLFKYIRVTENERSLAEQKVLKAIIEAQDRQRSELAKELHDGLGPLLSTAQMSITAIKPEGEFQQKVVANAVEAITLSIKTLKTASNSLSSHVLDNFGLSRALTAVVRSFLVLQKLKIHYYTNLENRRFPSDVELAIYRIACELLNNTFKHSGAKTINFDVVWSGALIEIHYKDDGCGFDMDKVTQGMGLQNIYSRVKGLGAKIDFVAQAGVGTRVDITIRTKEIKS